jgi:LytS/YehU family sensor histidine kinase
VKILIPYFGGSLQWTDKPFAFLLKKTLVNFSYVIFASLGSYFNWRGIIQIESDLEIDKRIIEAEFRLLKSQFHSHLTFNFLNFCYTKIRRFSHETAASVEEFSDMLRYSLKDKKEETVLLSEEIEYIENCISFQKCLTDELYVEFSYKGEIANVFILPRILVVFIENSFKHGVLNDSKNPIYIFINVLPAEIRFHIKNKKSNQIYMESGIGLQNIKQILQLFYPQSIPPLYHVL